jgi:hypothetical protein
MKIITTEKRNTATQEWLPVRTAGDVLGLLVNRYVSVPYLWTDMYQFFTCEPISISYLLANRYVSVLYLRTDMYQFFTCEPICISSLLENWYVSVLYLRTDMCQFFTCEPICLSSLLVFWVVPGCGNMRSYETSVSIKKSMRRYYPEARHRHLHRRENIILTDYSAMPNQLITRQW